jgi:hypothetical protein
VPERENGGIPRLCRAHDLLDPEDAGVVRSRDQVCGHGQVERDRVRARFQSRGERIVIERPRRVVDRERAVGELAQARPPGLQLIAAAHRRADAAEPAGPTDRHRELDLLPRTERRSDDRNLDTQELAQRRPQRDRGDQRAAAASPSCSIAASRSLNFCTLPVIVIGNSSVRMT